MNEINKDYFCSIKLGTNSTCIRDHFIDECFLHNERCHRLHRKHPTPEQFKEEYGIEVPDNIPVWINFKTLSNEWNGWELMQYKTALEVRNRCQMNGCYSVIVVACTPFGKPPADWRPE